MSFSIVQTMRLLIAPSAKVSCSWFLWHRLLRELRRRGRNCSRESGAFLLGHRGPGYARIVDFVPYDEIDPNCLDSGIVTMDGHRFAALWATCRQRGLAVVADVHVHPGNVEQSPSDKDNPMIARAGHISMILPRFAMGRISRSAIGIYQYCGAKLWTRVPPSDRLRFFHIGL